MPQISVMDLSGQVRDTLELDPSVFGAPAHGPLLHQAAVRERAGRRTGTHDTRGRSEVSGGGKKPWRQKGTGRARQGSIRATQWKGGGKPFGPTPRRYEQAMPRKARRAALRAALSDRVAGGSLMVVDRFHLETPRTKALVAVLQGLGAAGVPTLLVLGGRNEAVERAGRNIAWLRVAWPGQLSVVRLLGHQRVIFEREALAAVTEALSA